MNLECQNPAALIDVLLAVLPQSGTRLHASGDAEIRRIEGRFFELDHTARTVAGPYGSLGELLGRRTGVGAGSAGTAVRPVRWQGLYFLLGGDGEVRGAYGSPEEVRTAWVEGVGGAGCSGGRGTASMRGCES